MFQRAKYKANKDTPWYSIPNPVATRKYDGGHDFLTIDAKGNQSYYSRRPSVKGGFPEHTQKIPHISSKKLPEFAGQVFSVELIHTGHSKDNVESHPKVSGISNSLVPRAIQTQKDTGPVRAVLIDVINPVLPTYRDKLLHMKSLQDKFGNPDLLFVAHPAVGHEDIVKLIDETHRQGREGVIVTSLTEPEHKNPRIKVVHKTNLNLRVTGMTEEVDIQGKPKGSMGSLEISDASGRHVGNVGSGFDKQTRLEAFKEPEKWIGQLVQVTSRGISGPGGKLIAPVYNGFADGDPDLVQ